MGAGGRRGGVVGENTTVFYLYIKLLSHTLSNMISVYESAPAPCPARPVPDTLSASVENYLMTFLNLKRNM